jgi:phospholipid/cholesterol/gamma-HCH transport system substrate-binding protein
METRASYVLIGAFTLGILVAAFLFVLWIGKLQLDREWDWYDIVFNEAVTGLSVGGAVQYNGIQVGEVRRLSLGVDNPSQVLARVRVNGGTPVKVDTKAKLTLTGLTGVAVIQLSGGTSGAPMLADGNGDRIPQIIADESALQKLLASSGDIVTSVNDLLFKLKLVLKQENIDKVATTLANIESISSAAAAHSAEIGATIADIAEASKALRTTLARTEATLVKLEQLAETGNRVLDAEGRELLLAARASLESARRFTDSAQGVVADNREAIDSFTSQGMAQLGPAIADLRLALRNLQRLSEQLDSDPSVLLHGPEKVKEYDAR